MSSDKQKSATIWRESRGEIALLWFDYPDRSINVVDETVLTELRTNVDDVLEDDTFSSMVLASRKPDSFGAGADVSWLPELAASSNAETFLGGLKDLIIRIVRSSKPLVAALNGSAFGGALELALAARAIICVPDAVLGFPEVTLDLLPGSGGTQLLQRFVPTSVAAELLTSGRRIRASEAAHIGLVEAVVHADELIETACRRATEVAAEGTNMGKSAGEVSVDAIARRREELKGSRAGLSAAAGRILDAMEVGIEEGLEAGLAAETRHFLQQLRSPEARSAIHLFLVEAETKRRRPRSSSVVHQLGVVGGGQMGGGIAATAVSHGLSAVVCDLDPRAIDRALVYRNKVLERSRSDESTGKWSGSTNFDDLAEVDVVIEAVFEAPEVKDRVLRDLSSAVSSDALITTNTSAIPIHQLSTSVTNPSRFLGTHFFSPVERMRVVEIIPHALTATRSVERATSLCRQLGKLPVVVGDAPGFFTSRVYARWLIEGVQLLLEGMAPEKIDTAARAAGFPVGPMRAHDEATLDLVLQASITQVADQVMTKRLDVTAIRNALERLIESGIQGRRHRAGFYSYDADGNRGAPNGDVARVLDVQSSAISIDEASERLLIAFASECYLCWDDGTLCHPDDGDLVAVLGIGFPRTLGGPFHWADEVGAAEVVSRSRRLGAERFPTGPTMLDLVAKSGTFADQKRRNAPFEL